MRAPLTADGKAIVVLLPKPFVLLGLDQPATVVDRPVVFPVDLGGRGIRGIDRDENGAYVVLAGPVDDRGRNFALFLWDSSAPPAKIADVHLGRASPESVVIHRPGVAEILGDNGKVCSDESTPEGERWFPSMLVRY